MSALREYVRQHHVAMLALFVALGGTSYAAATLPKHSVGAAQIRNNAITSPKVKNHSLLAQDFEAGQLPRGLKGDTGSPGSPAPAINTGNMTTGSAGDYFGAPSGLSAGVTAPNEGQVQTLSPAGASTTARDFSLHIPFVNGNSNDTISGALRVNGVDTVLTCTIPDGSSSCQDTSHVATIPPNSLISIHTRVAFGGSGGAFTGTDWTFGWRSAP